MMTQAGEKLFRRSVVRAAVAFCAFGLVANIVTVVSAFRSRDSELIRSTDEVSGLIGRIYTFRQTKGKYPHSLAELRPIAGDVESRHEHSNVKNDEDYVSTWCWTYHFRGDVAPPFLSRHLGAHSRLQYEFAPSSGYWYPKGADEGWVVTDEGDKRYLKSFFSAPR